MSLGKAASLDEVWSGEMRAATVGGHRVVVIVTEGCVAAFEDRCPHLGVALSEGTLAGDVLTCRAHGWSYDARTGRGLNPEKVHLKRYAVAIDGNAVWVDPERVEGGDG